jgi:thioesterase III
VRALARIEVRRGRAIMPAGSAGLARGGQHPVGEPRLARRGVEAARGWCKRATGVLSPPGMTVTHEFRRVIRETDLDVFGHVNNARYILLLEEARWDLITQRGQGLVEILRDRVGPTILEIQIKFMRELTNRETVTIHSEVIEYAGKTGKIRQQIRKEAGAPACEAIMVFGLFDLDARRLVEPTPEWIRVFALS